MTTLHLDTQRALTLTAADCIGKRIAVLGASGSGKSMTASVLAEELLPHIPMTLIDIEGEMYGLREQHPILIVGGAHADLTIHAEQAAALAQWVWDSRTSVILDISDLDQDDQVDLLTAYLDALWNAAFRQAQPHTVLVEEAHEWMPQGGTTPLKKLLARIAARGRKRGLGMILVSQRSAKVDKNALTQCETYFLHRALHPTDLGVYADFVPLKRADADALITGLQVGQAVVVRSGTAHQVAQMRLRHTTHGGATPIGDRAHTSADHIAIDADLLSQLRDALSQPAPALPSPTPPLTGDVSGGMQHAEGGKSAQTGGISPVGQGGVSRAEFDALIAVVDRLTTLVSELDARLLRLVPPVQLGLFSAEASTALRERTEVETVTRTVTERTVAATASVLVERQRQAFDMAIRSLNTPGKRRVLRALCEAASDSRQPREGWTASALAWRLNYSEAGVRNALKGLTDAGLVQRVPARPSYFQITPDHLAMQYPDLANTTDLLALLLDITSAWVTQAA